MFKSPLTEGQAIALLKKWKYQGNTLLNLPRLIWIKNQVHIELPDSVSNQWYAVEGHYPNFQQALAAFGHLLDAC